MGAKQGVKVGSDERRVGVSADPVESAPDLDQHDGELSRADESARCHHYELNSTLAGTWSGRRLARR